MIKIINFEHPQLTINHWQVEQSESWCILGRNGSGKQYLDKLLTGQLTDATVELCQLPQAEKVALVSFETQQRIYEHELKMDASDYIDANDIGTKAKDFLPKDKLTDPLIADFGLSHRLEYGYRQLSTGEGRKLLILQAIFNGVELLICDNPFDSLDEASCLALSHALEHLSQERSESNVTVLLMLSNRQDIPKWCNNIAFIERSQLDVIGKLECDETKRQLDALLSPICDDVDWPERLNRKSVV